MVDNKIAIDSGNGWRQTGDKPFSEPMMSIKYENLVIRIYSGPLFTEKTLSYWFTDYKPETVVRQCYVYNGDPYTSKKAFLSD